MRAAKQSRDQSALVAQCDKWLTLHWRRLLACARKNADERTDADMLLTDTVRRVARVFCRRPMDEELLIRYTLRSIRRAAQKARRHNLVRSHAEEQYRRDEEQRRGSVGHELQRELRDLLQSLPEPFGSVLHLRLWERRSFADLAEHLGTSESSARRLYETAIDMMRNHINRF